MNKQEIIKIIEDLHQEWTENNADRDQLDMFKEQLLELINDQWIEETNQ